MKRLISFLLLIPLLVSAQYKIEVLDSSSFIRDTSIVLAKTSFRGLSVVDDQTIWVSGSRGTIARSINGGQSFTFNRISGYEKSDFRDIEAFDQNKAIVMSSGTPALILKTIDGGMTWKEVYRNNDSAYFLDALDFFDEKRGVVIGDPIDHHVVILTTRDGGDSWIQLKRRQTPEARTGESMFAASGTCMRYMKKNTIGFVTGGSISRFVVYNLRKHESQQAEIDLPKGSDGAGCFSFCMSDKYLFFAGGDYKNDTSQSVFNFNYYRKNFFEGGNLAGKNNQFNGYKSCVEVIDGDKTKKTLGNPHIIATGTSGTQIGHTVNSFIGTRFEFQQFPESFNVVQKSKKGKTVFLAGGKGRIGRLVY